MLPNDFTQTLRKALPPTHADADAKSRIRRNLDRRFAQSARNRRVGAMFAVAVTASAATGLVMHLRQSPTRPEQPSMTAAYGVSEDSAEQGARSTTEPPSIVHLASGARILVSAGGRITAVRDSAQDVLIRVEQGYAIFDVDKRDRSAKFAVVAGSVRAEVVGTTFAVGYGIDNQTAVVVYEGKVAVTEDDERVLVSAGGQWPLDRQLLEIPATQVARIMRTANPQAIDRVADSSGNTESHEAERSVTRPKRQTKSRTKSAKLLAADFVRARRLEKSGNMRAARRAYGRIADGSGAQAGDALYALGRIALREGNYDEARRSFTAYNARFENGAYARAVDVHLLDLSLSDEDDDAVVINADRFLKDHPGDPRADKFRLARASILAKRGRCDHAITDVLVLQPSPQVDRIRALCTVGEMLPRQ